MLSRVVDKHGADRLYVSRNTLKWQRKAFGKWSTIQSARLFPRGGWTSLANAFAEYHGLAVKFV